VADDRNDRRSHLSEPPDGGSEIEATIRKDALDVEGEVGDAAEDALGRVSAGFIASSGGDSHDQRLRANQDERGTVAMALGRAIARGRRTEFSEVLVRVAVVVEIDEVETDDPRPAWAEDHRSLFGEQAVDDCFEYLRKNRMELRKGVVVGVGFERAVSDCLGRCSANGCSRDGLPDDPGVEGCTFDSGEGKRAEETNR